MIASNPKEYWDTLRNLKNECSNNRDSVEYISLDTWKTHLQQIHDKPARLNDTLTENLKQEEETPYFSMLDRRLTEGEVQKAIQTLKKGKAPGYDQILGEMLRAGKGALIQPLTTLFNKVFTSKQYAQEWNRGVMTPIHKKGSKVDPNNYRGITVNSVLAKTYSMVLSSRLESFLEENKIIHDTQIGF